MKIRRTKRRNYIISIRSSRTLIPLQINAKFLSTRLNLTNRIQFRPLSLPFPFFSFVWILSSPNHREKKKKKKRISSRPSRAFTRSSRSPRKAAIPRALSRVRRAWEAAEWHKGARCGCRRFYLSPRAMHRGNARETRVALAPSKRIQIHLRSKLDETNFSSNSWKWDWIASFVFNLLR